MIDFLNNVLEDIDWHTYGLYADEGNFDNSRGLDIAQRSLIIGLMIFTLSSKWFTIMADQDWLDWQVVLTINSDPDTIKGRYESSSQKQKV